MPTRIASTFLPITTMSCFGFCVFLVHWLRKKKKKSSKMYEWRLKHKAFVLWLHYLKKKIWHRFKLLRPPPSPTQLSQGHDAERSRSMAKIISGVSPLQPVQTWTYSIRIRVLHGDQYQHKTSRYTVYFQTATKKIAQGLNVWVLMDRLSICPRLTTF